MHWSCLGFPPCVCKKTQRHQLSNHSSHTCDRKPCRPIMRSCTTCQFLSGHFFFFYFSISISILRLGITIRNRSNNRHSMHICLNTLICNSHRPILCHSHAAKPAMYFSSFSNSIAAIEVVGRTWGVKLRQRLGGMSGMLTLLALLPVGLNSNDFEFASKIFRSLTKSE